MDEETLVVLLRGGRMSAEERVQRGLWPHPPLRMKALEATVARLVERDGAFPHPWRPHRPGEPVDEHAVIERLGPLRYVFRARRHCATDPFRVAETGTRWFLTARGAARHYLRWELHLPGDLDGWTVE
jgi:hypothetical protein